MPDDTAPGAGARVVPQPFHSIRRIAEARSKTRLWKRRVRLFEADNRNYLASVRWLQNAIYRQALSLVLCQHFYD